MMKRLSALFLSILILTSMTACAEKQEREVAMEEIVAAYESAGCAVSSNTYEPREDGSIGYVQADYPDGDYIYFLFFTSEKSARAYSDEVDHPGILYLFSLIFSDPTWQTVKTYRNISITYFNSSHYVPFEALTNEKT